MPPTPAPNARLATYAAAQARRHATLLTAAIQDSDAWRDPDGGTRRTMSAYSPPNEYNAELSSVRVNAHQLLKAARLLCYALAVTPDLDERETAQVLDAFAEHLRDEEPQAAMAVLDADVRHAFAVAQGWEEPPGL